MGLIKGIGDNLYHLGRFAEAIEYYNKALAREPNNVQVQDKARALIALERSTSNSNINTNEFIF